MLSRIEIGRAAEVLAAELVGARVERWVEPERGRVAFSLYHRDSSTDTPGRKFVLHLDARADSAHIGLIPKVPPAPKAMPAFCAYLRAHLSRSRIESVSIRGQDRLLDLEFSAREGRYHLLLSVFGRRSNLYLLDQNDQLILALRPLGETRPELEVGRRWVAPSHGAPQAGKDRFELDTGLGLLQAIGAKYAAGEEEQSAEDEKRTLLRALTKDRKATARRVERIEAELAEAEIADQLARDGELLKANLGRVESGATSVEVDDWDGTARIKVALDPKLSPADNLAAIFRRYQKLLRRLTKAGGQIDQAREALAKTEGLIEEIESAPDLESIREREEVKRLLGRHAARAQRPSRAAAAEKPKPPAAYRDLPRKLHPRRYATRESLEIWVGRSDEGNDVLTTRLARGKDLFFHLDGAPGSHVILRTAGMDEPPPEAILDACELAVHFSKHKNAGTADVHVAPIKFVKKPKGAKRGLVYVTGGKSIHLRREETRLARLLDAQFPD